MMERMRKIRIWRGIALVGLSLSFLFGLGVGAHAQDANEILAKAAAAYKQSNGIRVEFTLQTRSEGQQAGESFEGTIQMKGDKFVLTTPDVVTWFDGKTQWTYVARTEEVNVTNPSGEDLRNTNPMLLLGSYQSGYTPSFRGESTAPNGKTAYDIVLTPKRKGDVARVELQIEKYSSLPASIKVSAKNGINSTVRITQLRTGVNQPDRTFVFNEEAYPDAEIVDLR